MSADNEALKNAMVHLLIAQRFCVLDALSSE